jgi:hypothetical protein
MGCTVKQAQLDGSLLEGAGIGERGESEHGGNVGGGELPGGVVQWRGLRGCQVQTGGEFVRVDHLIEKATTEEGPVRRRIRRLVKEERDGIARAGEADEVAVAFGGLVDDTCEGADGGRVAPGLTFREGEMAMFCLERVPHGEIEEMQRDGG